MSHITRERQGGVHPATDRSFLSTTGRGIAHLQDDGTLTHYLETESVTSIAVGPVGSGLVLVGTAGNGVFRSDDSGANWAHSGLEGETVMAVAVAPGDPERWYAGVRPSGVYRSDDRGANWVDCESFQSIRGRRLWRSPASAPFTAYVQALAVSPEDPDLVVAGIEFGAVVRSTDGGATWSNHRRKAIRDCHSLVWHATDGDWVYEAGAGMGRRPGARSTDDGATWRRSDRLDRGYGWAVAAHPEDPDVWYVSASTGPFAAHGDGDANAAVYRCTDDAWTRLDALPGESMPYALVTDPAFPDHLWAGLADGSLWHSPDRGETWDRLDGALPAVERSMVLLS